MRLLCQSPLLFSLLLLLALLSLACGQSANYTVLYVSYPACDLAVDISGFIYIGLCTGGVERFNASASLDSTYQARYASALNSSSAYMRPLKAELYAVSASGTVWAMDSLNEQLVGVSNVGLPNASVSVLSIVPEDDALYFSIAPNSNNLWVVFPGLPSAPVQQLSPTGAVLQHWNGTTSPGLTDFFPFGIYAATSGAVYVGGCSPMSALSWAVFQGYGGYEFVDDPDAIIGCSVRKFSGNGTLLQTFSPTRPASNYRNVSTFTSIVVDNSGAVYALDSFNTLAYKWSSSGVQQVVTDTRLYDLTLNPVTNVVYALTNDDPFAVVTVNASTLLVQSSFEISSNNLDDEQAVALSPDGSILYAVNPILGGRVLALNTSTGAVLGYLGAGTFRNSIWITTDKAGNLYITDNFLNVVVKLSPNGTLLQTFSSDVQPFVFPYGVGINPVTNEVVVADPFSSALVVFAPDGSLARVIDTSQYVNAVRSGYSQPFDVAISSKGVIVYTDAGLDDVVILTPQGNATMLFSNKEIDFSQTFGSYLYAVALSSDDRIFVSQGNPSAVNVFSMSGLLLGTLIYPAQNLAIVGLAYSTKLNLLYGADGNDNQIVSFSAVPPVGLNGSLCVIMYGLPGNVDYPWSVATSLQFQYLPHPISTSSGTGYLLLTTTGTRTFTNRFGASTTSSVGLGLEGADNLLYINASIPVDSNGILLTIQNGPPVQLPGLGPLSLYDGIQLSTASGGVSESYSTRVDSMGTAFISNLPGFRSTTIGASNLNALAPNYQTCTAPITFTNGLRPPVEPTASSSAAHFIYSYFISDGVTYSVNASLLITASSAFASTFDLLGNPYQTVVAIAGTRVYTYLPTNARVVSNITGLLPHLAANIYDQLFYPYALLAASPGVYTINTAPFLDGNGLAYSYDPAGPPLGAEPGQGYNDVGGANVFVDASMAAAVLEEEAVSHGYYGYYFDTPASGLITLQQQSLRLLL